jgi:hypothetical protein
MIKMTLNRAYIPFLVMVLSLMTTHCDSANHAEGDGGPDASPVSSGYVGQMSLKYRDFAPFIDEETCINVEIDLDGVVSYETDETCTGVLQYNETLEDSSIKVTKTGSMTLTPTEGSVVGDKVNIDQSTLLAGLTEKWARMTIDGEWVKAVDEVLDTEWRGSLPFSLFNSQTEDGSIRRMEPPPELDAAWEFIWTLKLDIKRGS